MRSLKVQLIHPGKQKPFNLRKGYILLSNSQIVREWCNDEKYNPIPGSKKAFEHYRKFIQNQGQYLSSIKSKPKEADLLFWGEWEGHSIFNPLPNSDRKRFPNGIHRPFHSILNKGAQNTDPYVYGDYFKYAVCLQKGALTKLPPLSLILFGTTYIKLNAFYLDTVFVVDSSVPAKKVMTTGASAYSRTYREATLNQLDEYNGNTLSEVKLYHGLTWWDNNKYFSFVPSKANPNRGFERLRIDLGDPLFSLAGNTQGYSYLPKCSLSPQELWEKIALRCFKEGFVLGIRFQEPEINNTILDSVSRF